jgi:AcrR family transcriptional regulator
MSNSKRELQKEQTHALLLKTAFDQFGKNGIMATRMSDIAKAAGVSHGTVFAHFETQEILVTSVIEYFGDIIASRTHELARDCAGVREVLKAYLACIAEFEAFYTDW